MTTQDLGGSGPRIELKARFKTNRDIPGTLAVIIDGYHIRSVPVLGRGSAGKGDTQFLNKGNTPTGLYEVTAYEPKGKRNPASYGEHGVLRIKPISGNAVIAYETHHRFGLLIHGGAASSERSKRFKPSGDTDLHPTHGCLRLSDHNMSVLLWDIRCSKVPFGVGCIVLDVSEE